MHLPLPDEVARATYEQAQKNGATQQEAETYALWNRGNMGYIYGSMMAIPAKIILIVGLAVLMYTSILDEMTPMGRFATIFGAVWVRWTIAVVFAIKMRSIIMWVLYVIAHALLGLMVISALISFSGLFSWLIGGARPSASVLESIQNFTPPPEADTRHRCLAA